MRNNLAKVLRDQYLPGVSPSDFQAELLNLVSDLISELEALWDYDSIRYDTVMSADDWKRFADHPERCPYKSKLLKSKTLEQKYVFVFDFLKSVFPYYAPLRESDYKKRLRLSLSTLLECFFHFRFDSESMRLADTYIGRSKGDRDSGKINPTAAVSARLDYALKEYAFFTGQDHAKFREKIMEICDGRPSILVEYFVTCDMSNEFRQDVRGILRALGRDLTLSFYNLKLGWEVWKDLREIGLDTEKFLAFNELPSYAKVKRKLLSFQKKPSYVRELEAHMEDDLPESYKKYVQQGFVYYHDIIAEEAKRKKYPKSLRPITEVEQMVREAREEVFNYFPLARKPSPRNVLFNPLHPESTMRAFQSSTKNTKGLRVNSIVMTPRTELPDEYLPIFAHETTHALHRIVLEMGELTDILPKGATELVPSSVMEEFSQLVQGQFYSDKKLPYKKKFKGKEFPNFRSGWVQRFQVPYALVQLGVRKKFDKLWDEGYRGSLTDPMIWEIKNEFDPKVREWTSLGLDVRYEMYDSLRYFSATSPGDGLVYMKKYIFEEVGGVSEGDFVESLRQDPGSEASAQEAVSEALTQPVISEAAAQNAPSQEVPLENSFSISMAQAFEQKYGKKWISNKQARTTLLWLLLESGRDPASEKYSDYILNGDVVEFEAELKKIGITSSQI